MLIITVIIAFYYLSKGEEKMIYVLSKGKMNLIALRAVFSVISISLTIFALKYISISEVYSVFYIYPGMVMLLSYFILKEKVGLFDLFCLVSCFIGVLLIIRPSILFPNEASAIKASAGMFLLVILGAFLKACEDIIIRNVGKEVHFLVVPSIYSVVAMVLYPLTLFFSEGNLFVKTDFKDVIFISFIAIFSFLYQALMSLAIQNENAGRVSMVNYLQVFFMFLSDLLIFKREMVFLDLLGTFLILVFNLYNSIRKAIQRSANLKEMQLTEKMRISRDV
jgi:drug/metabolite transporter (DMT)-like permease